MHEQDYELLPEDIRRQEQNAIFLQATIEEIRTQATKSGYASAEGAQRGAERQNENGPFWPKSQWEVYSTRVINILIETLNLSRTNAQEIVRENSKGIILVEG